MLKRDYLRHEIFIEDSSSLIWRPDGITLLP